MPTTLNLNKLQKIRSIVLCKINKTEIGEIPVDFINNEKRNLNDIDKIELTIPKYITNRRTKKKEVYHLYKEFKNKRYLYINDNEYFIIDKIKENKRKTEKTITAHRGEYRLSTLNIYLENIYIQLMSEDLSDSNYPIYSFNDLLYNRTGWKIGNIDDNVLYEDIDNKIEKLRKIENVDTNWYDFITDTICEMFNCIAFFDTVNKKVDLVLIENFGEDIQLCLSYDNYMNDLAIESDSKDLITRLTLINDNLDIAGNTITGYNHINNFSYFIEIEEMSNELIKALEVYEQMITERNAQWKALRDEKLSKQSELNIKKNRWLILNSELNIILNQINIFKTQKDATNMVLKQNEYNEKKDNETLLREEIKQLEEQIDLLTDSIDNINSLCRYETCTDSNGQLVFNEELLNELREFIFEDSFKEDSYLNEEDMIAAGERKLELACKPTITYDIDVFNFLNKIIDNNFRKQWKGNLSFGDIIILLDDEGNETYVYFTGFDYDYKSENLSLTLANKKEYKDNIRTIRDTVRTNKKINKLLSQNGYLFNSTKNLRLNMGEDRPIQ